MALKSMKLYGPTDNSCCRFQDIPRYSQIFQVIHGNMFPLCSAYWLSGSSLMPYAWTPADMIGLIGLMGPVLLVISKQKCENHPTFLPSSFPFQNVLHTNRMVEMDRNGWEWENCMQQLPKGIEGNQIQLKLCQRFVFVLFWGLLFFHVQKFHEIPIHYYTGLDLLMHFPRRIPAENIHGFSPKIHGRRRS